ncbi:MAG TPA: molybdenum cofactor biosynthesis protein MoaE [Chthoniobacterales bacterium]
MANPVCEILLTDVALLPGSDIPFGSGASVEFLGMVRPQEDNRELAGIDYEAHRPMATHHLEKIARAATLKFDLTGAIIHHRLGLVPVGEPSVLVRTTSRHRAESYRANEWIMDELKKSVPIWKRVRFKSDELSRSAPESASL